MYSEYTLHAQHTICVSCIMYTVLCKPIIQIASYTLIIYRMYVKINVLYVQCTVYTVHIAYICALRNKPFYLPSQDQRILRALVK